jgi:hypothetical protein
MIYKFGFLSSPLVYLFPYKTSMPYSLSGHFHYGKDNLILLPSILLSSFFTLLALFRTPRGRRLILKYNMPLIKFPFYTFQTPTPNGGKVTSILHSLPCASTFTASTGSPFNTPLPPNT